MDKIIEMLKGNKTYIIAGAIAALGVLDGLGIFIVPEWLWAVLGGLGLTTLRAGVASVSAAVKQK